MSKLRTILLAGIAMAGVHGAQAQIQKGNLMVGANIADMKIGLQSGNTDLSLTINPKAGYFIEDNIAIGAQVQLGMATNTAQNSISYGIGAFGRYYISDRRTVLLRHSRFFVEANVGFTGDNVETKTTPKRSVTTNGLGFGVGPGLAYFITPNIGLEALLKYDLGVGFGNSVTTNRFSLAVGFQIYLPTRKAREVYNEASGEVRERKRRHDDDRNEMRERRRDRDDDNDD